MAPLVTWSVRALGGARRRLLRGRGRACLPRSRPSPSPWVRQGGDHRLRPGLSPSPGVGRGGVRRLPGPRPSLCPGVGRGGVRRLPGPRPSPGPGVGRGGASYGVRGRTWLLSASLVEWHSRRSGAGGAVFLSGRSVERRSDCGHFGSVD
jgi:hypothetical protein